MYLYPTLQFSRLHEQQSLESSFSSALPFWNHLLVGIDSDYMKSSIARCAMESRWEDSMESIKEKSRFMRPSFSQTLHSRMYLDIGIWHTQCEIHIHKWPHMHMPSVTLLLLWRQIASSLAVRARRLSQFLWTLVISHTNYQHVRESIQKTQNKDTNKVLEHLKLFGVPN